jgi:hypothetical protein
MTSIYVQKITVGHPVVHPMNNSTTLFWGYKKWATWLKWEVHTSNGTAAVLQEE